jgi:hypothetical protein
MTSPEWKSYRLAGTGDSSSVSLVTASIGPRREPRDIQVALPPR